MDANNFYEAMIGGARLIHVEEHEALIRPGEGWGELVPQAVRRSKNFRLFLSGYYITYCNGKEAWRLNLREDGSAEVLREACDEGQRT